MLGLGIWQLDRARQKDLRHTRYLANVAGEPCRELACLELLIVDPDAPGRRVQQGSPSWLPLRMLLDNQVHHGRAGYLLLQALDTTPAILVQRAFVEAASERGQTPALPELSGSAGLEAEIAWPPATGLQLSAVVEAEPMASGLVRLQSLDPAILEVLLGRAVAPLVLRELPVGQSGPLRPWRTPGSGADRHRAYALQWFTMAAVLAWLYWMHRQRRGRSGS